MRKPVKAVIVVISAIVVLAALAAAAWDAPQGHIPQHNILRGSNSMIGAATANVGTILQRKGSVPQGRLVSHVILSGPITPSMRKANPQLPVAQTIWQCDFYAYAGKGSYPDILWAEGYVLCNESMPIVQDIYADRCNPILWGCTWAMQYHMGPTCSTTYVGQYCPASGAYSGVVQTGYLWRGRSHACVTPPGDIQRCINSAKEIQF